MNYLRFEEAARKEDEANIERLFKLFPQIGKAEEGVDLLAKYLAGKVIQYTLMMLWLPCLTIVGDQVEVCHILTPL